MVRRGETKPDTAGFLGCSCQAVSMAVVNGYKVPDKLDEDADYLCGKLGELIDVDELNDGGPQVKREFREDERDEIKPIAHTRGRMPMLMTSIASSDYELTSNAMFVDDGDVGSDSDAELDSADQPQERKSARLLGIKPPSKPGFDLYLTMSDDHSVVRMSVSPTWQARQKRARTCSQSAQSVVEISSDEEEDVETRLSDVVAPAKPQQSKKKVRYGEPADKPGIFVSIFLAATKCSYGCPVEIQIKGSPAPKQKQGGEMLESSPPREVRANSSYSWIAEAHPSLSSSSGQHWTAPPTQPVSLVSQEFQHKQLASIKLAVQDGMLERFRLLKDEISRFFNDEILPVLEGETRQARRQAKKNIAAELSARILALNDGIGQLSARNASRCTCPEQQERPFLPSLSIAKKATRGSSVVDIKPAVARRQPIADASLQRPSPSSCISANDQPAARFTPSPATPIGSSKNAKTKVESKPTVQAGHLRPTGLQMLPESKAPLDDVHMPFTHSDSVVRKAQGRTPSRKTTESASSSKPTEDVDQKNGDIKNINILSSMNFGAEHGEVVAAINVNMASDLRRWSELDEQAHRLIIDTDLRRKGISTFRYVKLLTARFGDKTGGSSEEVRGKMMCKPHCTGNLKCKEKEQVDAVDPFHDDAQKPDQDEGKPSQSQSVEPGLHQDKSVRAATTVPAGM
ncbi:hypothetical protein EWM64_g7003 [Hericium alpestre]|uniref:Uncharacterized protein n=1 Tax=Hericium alpestre TaxID=135208 RepID=A0A4Y9ZQ23_9AGAM|nr:hypothetical protein EWM64_g7003 [Hericium alpestre]